MTIQKTDLKRLSLGLDTWGADLSRWPDAERNAAEAMLAASADARRLHGETRALERTLALAPDATAPSAGLSDRILAAALAERPAAAAPTARAETSAAVVPISRPRPAAASASATAPQRGPARTAAARWQAAAVMVLALATGVLIGTMDVVPEAAGWLLEVAGFETDINQVATIQFDGLPQMIDEDQL